MATTKMTISEFRALEAWVKKHADQINGSLIGDLRTMLRYSEDRPGWPKTRNYSDEILYQTLARCGAVVLERTITFK